MGPSSRFRVRPRSVRGRAFAPCSWMGAPSIARTTRSLRAAPPHAATRTQRARCCAPRSICCAPFTTTSARSATHARPRCCAARAHARTSTAAAKRRANLSSSCPSPSASAIAIARCSQRLRAPPPIACPRPTTSACSRCPRATARSRSQWARSCTSPPRSCLPLRSWCAKGATSSCSTRRDRWAPTRRPRTRRPRTRQPRTTHAGTLRARTLQAETMHARTPRARIRRMVMAAQATPCATSRCDAHHLKRCSGFRCGRRRHQRRLLRCRTVARLRGLHRRDRRALPLGRVLLDLLDEVPQVPVLLHEHSVRMQARSLDVMRAFASADEQDWH